jgi:hypothetical protein
MSPNISSSPGSELYCSFRQPIILHPFNMGPPLPLHFSASSSVLKRPCRILEVYLRYIYPQKGLDNQWTNYSKIRFNKYVPIVHHWNGLPPTDTEWHSFNLWMSTSCRETRRCHQIQLTVTVWRQSNVNTWANCESTDSPYSLSRCILQLA